MLCFLDDGAGMDSSKWEYIVSLFHSERNWEFKPYSSDYKGIGEDNLLHLSAVMWEVGVHSCKIPCMWEQNLLFVLETHSEPIRSGCCEWLAWNGFLEPERWILIFLFDKHTLLLLEDIEDTRRSSEEPPLPISWQSVHTLPHVQVEREGVSGNDQWPHLSWFSCKPGKVLPDFITASDTADSALPHLTKLHNSGMDCQTTNCDQSNSLLDISELLFLTLYKDCFLTFS